MSPEEEALMYQEALPGLIFLQQHFLLPAATPVSALNNFFYTKK
jgi:hypothetical protein